MAPFVSSDCRAVGSPHGGGGDRFVGPERIDDLTNFWLQLHQHIESFLVVSDVRGQGVGRRLLDAALAHLRKVGIRTAGLDVVSTNTAARRFYEREGFVPTFLHMYRAISVA